jgi:hypothetical protein
MAPAGIPLRLPKPFDLPSGARYIGCVNDTLNLNLLLANALLTSVAVGV